MVEKKYGQFPPSWSLGPGTRRSVGDPERQFHHGQSRPMLHPGHTLHSTKYSPALFFFFSLLRAGLLLDTGLVGPVCVFWLPVGPSNSNPPRLSAFPQNAITACAYRSDCSLCYPSIPRDRSPWDGHRLHVPRLSRVLGGCHKSQPNGPERPPSLYFQRQPL